MKKISSLIVMFVLGSLLFAQNAPTAPASKKDGPNIQFKDDLHDFGKIKEGIIATYDFVFTNTGSQPLLLTDVRPSCGCTTPEWPREPIQPGKTGIIHVKYNSAGRPGNFNKSITVVTNIPDKTLVLFIKGNVEPSTENNNMQDPNQSPVRIGN
jgi:hypothetical protein